MNPRPNGPRVYEQLLNNYVFSTQGDWDTTTLTNNGEQVMASRLFVQYRALHGDNQGNPGAGEVTAVWFDQDNPEEEIGFFPGMLTIDVPRHKIEIVNRDPHFTFELTRIAYQGIEVTPSISEIFLEIDADKNVVQGWIGIYQTHRNNDIETFTIL